ncbi:hypothetical protein ACEPPN_015786 [Leptodophora sp. 'Broadleaf-Isolate-01']
MAAQSRKKNGCTSCRRRHLKCDNLEPSCANCVAANLECARLLNVRFRHVTDVGPSYREQTWVKTAGRNHLFVDESPFLRTIYNSDEGQSPGIVFADPPHIYPQSNAQLSTTPSTGPPPITSPYPVTDPAPGSACTGPYSISVLRPLSEIPLGSNVSLATKAEPEGGIAFPLRQEPEVRLMKYYIDYMCHWFDLCDTRGNHFGQELPRRAIESPTLLNAIFAVSSRHLSVIGQFDQYASDRYHQDCLKHLRNIPINDPALIKDDLLAATILLRTLEELDVPLVGEDYQGHLLGIQIFMNAQDPSIPASGLRQASFWIGLRQDIYMAFVNQRPLKTKLDHSFIDRSFTPADDDTWAKRILINTAEIENFCFSDNEQPVSTYRRLKEYDERWLESRPLSWLPLSYRAPNEACGEVFPEIWYMNHAVVIGIVHSIIGRVLLMCYNPTLPRIGPTHRNALEEVEEEIRKQIRELCGTALSNRRTIPALFTACMGVTMCGDRFSDRGEQEALLNVLVVTEEDHAWPTFAAQMHLKRAWGWSVDA